MNNLSAVIITKNAEQNIKVCLDALSWADEVVVVDHMSGDKTVEICQRYPNVKVYAYARKAKELFGPSRNFSLSKATGDWALVLDADELVTPELADEIKQAIKDETKSGYFLARKNIFLGRWIKSCGWWPDYNIRLFRVGIAYWPRGIHDTIKIEDKRRVGYLKNPLVHNSYLSLEQYFYKFDFYTDQLAYQEYEKGIKSSILNFCIQSIFKPPLWFLRKFFILKGYRDGFYGFFISFSSALVIFVTYAKLWEACQSEENLR